LEQALNSLIPSSWDNGLVAELLGHSGSQSDSMVVQIVQVKTNKNSTKMQLATM